jgi:hypothetical protein
MGGSGAGLVGGALAAEVGLASTLRPVVTISERSPRMLWSKRPG